MPDLTELRPVLAIAGHDAHRQAELHALLSGRIADISKPLRTMPLIALVDVVAEEEADLRSHLDRMKEDAIIVLQRAMRKVKTGEYGNCRVRLGDHPCDRRISMRRLRKFPLTAKCGTCERRERLQRPQLRRR